MLKKLLSLCFLLTGALCAQVDTSAIVGTLRDSSGAVITSAGITLTEQETNISTVVHANTEGDYTSPPLRVGTYSVTVEAAGFQSQTRTGITLQIQDRRRVDFTMTPGKVSEHVTVTDEAPSIQTETSSLGQVISSATITALPLNGRDYLQLATLSAGVIATSSGTNGNTGGGSSTGSQNSFAANGARGTMNNFLLDGIDNNSNDTGGLILRTSVDAIQEFKIQTNSFSAEFGRGGGAAINAIIKSGTNAYHGGVFEFIRNSAMDARRLLRGSHHQGRRHSSKINLARRLGGPILQGQALLVWRLSGNHQPHSNVVHRPRCPPPPSATATSPRRETRSSTTRPATTP